MLKLFKWIIMSLITCVVIAGMVLAEETTKPITEDKSAEVEEIVVTASRIKTRVEDVPNSITIISNEDIKASPFEKVEDILRGTPGVNVNYHYGMNIVGGNRPVNLRGTGGYGERTLVLVDGIPQNNVYTGWVEWSQISKESIERIEILRGPASGLYGSNAIGGVINIITKKPESTRQTIFQQKYGSMNTLLTKLGQSGKSGKFSYCFNGEYEQSDGYKGTDPEQSYDIKRFRKEDRVLTKFMYELDDKSAFTLGYSQFYSKRGGRREYEYGYSRNNHFWLNWSKDGESVSGGDWLATLRFNNDEWTNLYDRPPTYSSLYLKESIPTSGLGGSVQSTLRLFDKYTMVTGIDYTDNKLDIDKKYYTGGRSGGAKGEQLLIAPFIHNEFKLLDNHLITTLGARYDWIKSYNGKNWDTNPAPSPAYQNDFPAHQWRKFSPKLGLVYHLNNVTTLKSSVGSGFKAPSLFELYATYMRGPLLIESNPQLQPEKVLSYDAGIEQQFLDNLLGKLTLYQSNARDYIGERTISVTPPRKSRWDNITKVKIQGVESALDWQITNEFSTLFNYTYNKSKIVEYTTDPTVEDNYLANTPLNSYQFGVAYRQPELFDCQAVLNYNGKRFDNDQNTIELNSYYTFNISLVRNFGKYSRLSVDVENLFDKEYTVYKGTTQDILSPGRVVNLSLNVNF
ncbi:MAG: TonB-dependent receptor [Planctomycetota bacterium]|nr:TonB-dependent receptor [Planctomycetota bacterium]MDI6788394.1 TonB-dependent receptor [Planctomycetota bacterium]